MRLASNFALMIWITRNWTTSQINSKAVEVERGKGKAANVRKYVRLNGFCHASESPELSSMP
jgi:hypothetical protein